MELKEIMQKKRFAVVGDTLNPDKYAYKIKQGLLEKGFTVYAVGKELASLNDIPEDIEIIDLCINAKKGLQLMQECKKSFDCIVIQPGAESDALKQYLDDNKLPYVENCLLIGMRKYT